MLSFSSSLGVGRLLLFVCVQIPLVTSHWKHLLVLWNSSSYQLFYVALFLLDASSDVQGKDLWLLYAMTLTMLVWFPLGVWKDPNLATIVYFTAIHINCLPVKLVFSQAIRVLGTFICSTSILHLKAWICVIHCQMNLWRLLFVCSLS